jgi:hypothetical protein
LGGCAPSAPATGVPADCPAAAWMPWEAS